MPLNAAISRPFERIGVEGERAPITRALAEETPVAIECNGIGYAVLMATPVDLLDLACGFALTERLVDGAGDIVDVEVHAAEAGAIVRLTLAERVAGRLLDRVRHRTTDSSCGLCGIENLEQALRPLPRLAARWDGEDSAVFAALPALDRHQPLNDRTRAVHAAAACTREGAIRLVREDVGRHNAFDKLIGAMLRAGLDWEGGFALLTSRCSFELVEKAVLSGCPMLATLSAPTRLAVDRALGAGLALRTLVRPDALLRTPEFVDRSSDTC
ncbi:formate dehydrogenase accessory sulfurtransferase FdhD [Sphingomonas sp. MMS12-HWE2-04]|uniref:formate dehydrogenase accessory sulfurtransferase FdhD n=1 Tax=Sphingomonas sp. MMS12-HWE2-04 TaxID=3234199 RepID=UPI0038514B57